MNVLPDFDKYFLGSNPPLSTLVSVKAPEYAILGQTVHLHCNFSLPPGNTDFYSLKVSFNFYYNGI